MGNTMFQGINYKHDDRRQTAAFNNRMFASQISDDSDVPKPKNIFN
jgi:hypothetical protein